LHNLLAQLPGFMAPRRLDLSGMARVLCFAPHPDDESLGCGSTLTFLAKAGARVHVVLITDGSGGGLPEGSDKIRQNEFRAALRVLGVESHTLCLQSDGYLLPHDDWVGMCLEIVERLDPQWVFFCLDLLIITETTLPPPLHLPPSFQLKAPWKRLSITKPGRLSWLCILWTLPLSSAKNWKQSSPIASPWAAKITSEQWRGLTPTGVCTSDSTARQRHFSSKIPLAIALQYGFGG
jgi:hypothetical protein